MMEVTAAVAACFRAPVADTAVAEGSGWVAARARGGAARARAAAARARVAAAAASARMAAMKVAMADVMAVKVVKVVKVVEREEAVMEAVREEVKAAAATEPQIPVTRWVSLSCFRPRCRGLC